MEIDKPIAVAIMLFIVLVLAFYLVTPKYKIFQDLLIKLGAKEAEFQGKSAYFIEVTETYKELMQEQDSLKKIETALPDKLSLALLVNFLYKKSSENGIIIRQLSILKSSSPDKETGIKETNLSLNLFGSYEAFKKFLSSVEKSARLIEGEGFAFSITPSSLANPVVLETFPIKLDIKVRSY